MSNKESFGTQQPLMFEHTARLGYLLFLPQGYGADTAEKWPLIVYLHGMGERGVDLELVKTHGIPKVAERQPGFAFVGLSPQCPDGTFWSEHLSILKALLGHTIAKYAIDDRRVYLTGNSMGGYGTWSLAAAYPDRFSAIAPICGGGSLAMASALKGVPVWAFHGAKDPLVPVKESQRMVDALKASGGDVRFTVYPGVGHDSWTQTYENPELYNWFLQHTR